ncbi:GIY-YIG nuclease family protein [Brevundimonas sp.]|uniref:GIY-YIG nuclease family protein n=1 Tax=Brevundimonas sp. TaxID=1871086 RepID=UPI002FCC1161
MASQRNGTLYTGSTDNIGHRAWQHAQGVGSGFTSKYGVGTLVWFETYETRMRRFGASARSRNGTANGNCG